METTFKGSSLLKFLSTALGATLGLLSCPIGWWGLLHFLPYTMPNLPMMRCTFLHLILTFCSEQGCQ